tara:strand:- start:9040 stop:10764 length:1725 start_codon:yes stop_codon:yes gene_type:complete
MENQSNFSSPPNILEGITEYQKANIRQLHVEKAKRESEALRLYEPLPFQDKYHACNAKEALIQAGNQVGKSLCAFVEDARAATGQDPYGKYPKENGIMVCLGMDEGHIGRTIHKYLFRDGSFKIIKDLNTRRWRAWKPWIESDWERKSEAKPAPPLIPERFIKQFAWKKRAQHVFEICELHNGWTIYAMGSKGDPSQGFQADLVHIDEDLERSEWYDEMIARLSMRDGKLRWSALPHSKNDALVNLSERAEDEEGSSNPSTVVFRATIFDNPFMPEQVKQENIKRWKAKGEDEFRKRALGELVTDSVLMYPNFSKDVHNAIKFDEPRNKVQEYLTKNNGQPGEDWCKYMVVDPGHSTCAVTFLAVPSPTMGRHVVCYDELYIHNCTAAKFGDMVAQKVRQHQGQFEAFIIDAHGGRIREIGSGVLPRVQYSKELERHNVKSNTTGHGFLSGSDDVPGREMKLRSWININEKGVTELLVVTARCPNLCREFNRFKKKFANGYVTDEGNRRSNCHAIETLEYAAAHGLKYVKPKQKRVVRGIVGEIMKGRSMRAAQRSAKGKGPSSNTITLGPRGE